MLLSSYETRLKKGEDFLCPLFPIQRGQLPET